MMNDAPAEKNPWTIYVEKFLERVFGPTSKPSPQRELYEKALLLKAANQHVFMPRGRGARNAEVLTGGPIVVRINKRDLGNPCYIERGVDWKTARALGARFEDVAKDMNAEFATRWQRLVQANEQLGAKSRFILGFWTEASRGTIEWWKARAAQIRAAMAAKGAQA